MWIRFPNLVNFSLGKTPERHEVKYWDNGKYPWFSIADMRDKETIFETKEKISEESYRDYFNSSLSPKGTLIMSFKLTVGRVSILGIDAVHNEAIISIFPYLNSENSIRDWLFYTLGIIVTFVEQTNAIKGNTLNKEKMSSMLIPLPPISEQRRIIDKINSFEPLIQEYDKNEKLLTELESTFAEKLKKSILQYAIEGKLVKQDPNDEPASVLLERIKAEKEKLIKEGKIKRDKNESYIYQGDDKNYYEKINNQILKLDLPFEIPSNWLWIRIQSLFDVVSASRVHQSDWKSEGIPFYRAREIGKLSDFGYVKNELYISEDLYNKFSKNTWPTENDLMITAVGTLGKTYIVKKYDKFYYKDASVISLKNKYNVNIKYIDFLFKSPYMIGQIKEKIAGTTVGTITIEKAQKYLIPFPSSNEQDRIIDKINHLNILINS